MTVGVAEFPISIEQLATVVEHMNQDEQQRLLELAPSLRQLVKQVQPRTLEQVQANVERLQARLFAQVGRKPLSPDAPFLGGLTWGQYEASTDEEKALLWRRWEEIDLLTMKEREVCPDVVPA